MRKLATLGIALVGLAFFVSAVAYLIFPLEVMLNNLGRLPRVIAFGLSLLPLIVGVAAGLFLLLRRERLAAAWFPETDAPLSVTSEDLVRVGLILIGAYLFFQAIPALITLIVSQVLNLAEISAQLPGETFNLQYFVQNLPNVVGILGRFAVGWFLLARAKKLASRFTPPEKPIESTQERQLPHCPSCGAEYDPADYEGGLSAPLRPECKQPLGISRD